MLNNLKSYAKINLYLNIISKLNDGYHELDSIITRIDLYDEIEIIKESKFSITFDGPYGSKINKDNNINRLFNYLIDMNYLSKPSFAINITKNIPIGSGLGGGSSNIAEIIKYLIKINLLDKSKSCEIARSLGSDIEFFLEDYSAMISGRGEVIQRLKIMSNEDILIVFPNIQNSTKDIFCNHSKISGKKLIHEDIINLNKILSSTSNDLESTALTMNTEMYHVKEFLTNDKNCKFERMTGSGSAYFGVYEDNHEANEAILRISKEHPNWWTYLTKII